MSFGRSIRIYLADGSPTGIKHAELVNWTGQAIVCPRARVAELSKWSESQRPGVYFLIGEDETATKPLIYIGQAEDVLDRLKRHLLTKPFWQHVVFFTNKDDNLTQAHVKYLESRMVALAVEAGRVALDNGNTPQLPSLPRADRDAMKEFLGPARLLLSALGFPFLQPVAKKPTEDDSNDGNSGGPLAHVTLYFEVPKRGVKAEGVSTDEGFVVFSGSLGDAKVRDSLSPGWKELREELLLQGKISLLGSQIRYSEDVLFKSPSAAAAVTAGGVWNGQSGWKSSKGVSLKELEQSLANVAADTEAL